MAWAGGSCEFIGVINLISFDLVGQEHDGRVLIHGRAFAEWLHNIFPRECPKPRAADFKGMAGDIVPDANADFQPTTALKADLFEW